jgi:hypothetical protein
MACWNSVGKQYLFGIGSQNRSKLPFDRSNTPFWNFFVYFAQRKEEMQLKVGSEKGRNRKQVPNVPRSVKKVIPVVERRSEM